MTREQAMLESLKDTAGRALTWRDGFEAGWDARKCPNLQPVIDWLMNGCDPKEAVKELMIYQAKRDAE
jgi:hypothetical protein